MKDNKSNSYKGKRPNKQNNFPKNNKSSNKSGVPLKLDILDKNLANISTDEAYNILKDMVERKSVFEYDTILPSGKITTHYVDLKETLLSAQGSYLASVLILSQLRDDIQAIGGSWDKVYTLGATTSQIALFRGIEMDCFLVRDSEAARRRGHSRWIEGPLKPGSKVCILHDEVVDGTKVIETIRRVQEESDAQIVQVIAIVDRMDGAKLRLQEYGVDYTSIFTMQDIVSKQAAMF
jgi:orotate phosphoribosyltransferase